MTNQRILLMFFAFIFICVLGCDRRKTTKTQSDFSFYIPEADVYMTTSKRVNAKFYVLFSIKPGIKTLSDSVSYIECETMNSTIVVVFNPKKKKSASVLYPNIKKIHETDFNLHMLTDGQFDTLFHEKRIRTNPLVLKEPYIELIIMPSTYTIILQRDSSFEKQIRIKEGDINGGW